MLSIITHAIRSIKKATPGEKARIAEFFRSDLFQLYMTFLGYEISGEAMVKKFNLDYPSSQSASSSKPNIPNTNTSGINGVDNS